MLLPVHLQDPEPPQSPRPSTGPDVSLHWLLAVASVLLNIPWMLLVAAYWWLEATSFRPPRGELLLVAIAAWLFLGLPGGMCGFASFVGFHYSSGKRRGLWIAGLGMLITVSGLPLAVALKIIT